MRTAIQSASSPQAIVTPRNPYSRIEFHTTAYGQTHARAPAAQASQRRPVDTPTTRPTSTAATADSSDAVTPIAHGLPPDTQATGATRYGSTPPYCWPQ